MSNTRGCTECGRHLPRSNFSNNQWSKGVGLSRCNACVHGTGGSSDNRAVQAANNTSRYNNATTASFTMHALDHPFSSGAFRWVAKGTYTKGERSGEACVCKWFKTGGVVEASFFNEDIHAVEKAAQLIQQFNAQNLVNLMIRINRPAVWTFEPGSEASWAGKKVLQEPFIESYQKFNSNTGWTDDATPWPRVMQALSHFSYHASGGHFVLCDLQGGVYSDGVVLTDPVVLSRNRQFGVTDLGSQGISTFFSRHSCNEFCRSNWTRPVDQRPYFEANQGTSMMQSNRQVPARSSRPAMTSFFEDDEESD
jgi:hypothetical protein